MRRVVVLAMGFALLCVAVWGQQPPEILAPPGGTLVTEINLSDSDVLGMLKQAIQGFAQSAAGSPGELGMALKSMDLNTLAEAIQGVKSLRVMQFKLGAGSEPGKILDFYQGQLMPAEGTSGWSRILYDTSMVPKGAVAIYSRAGQDFFGVGADGAGKRAFVFRTSGFVDVPKFATWLGGAAKFAAQMEAKKPVQPTPVVKKPTKPRPKTQPKAATHK